MADQPRGVRNNNPGNLVPGAGFQGEVETADERFAQFTSPEMGIRAMSKTLDTYRDRHGLNTIEGIINRWAPSSENDTASYVNFVATQLDKYPNEELTAGDRQGLVTAMITFENGSNPYSEAVIQEGLSASGLEFDDAPPPVDTSEFDFGPVVNARISEAGISKQAFMAATVDVMGGGVSWASTFSNIQAELRAGTKSPTLDAIMNRVQDQEMQRASQEARQALLSLGDSQQQEMKLREIVAEAQARGQDLEEAFRQRSLAGETPATDIEEEVHLNMIDSYQRTRDTYQDLTPFINANIPIEEGVQQVGVEEFGEAAVGAFIPGWGPMIASVANDVFPDAVEDWSDYATPGDVVVAVRNKLRDLPYEQQKEAVIRLRRSAEELGNTMLGNDWIAVDVYMSFLDGMIFDDDNNSFDQALFNAISYLEILPSLGTAVRGISKTAARTSLFGLMRSRINSQIAQMNRTSPRKAKEVYDSATEDLNDDQVAEVLGEDGSVLGYEHTYPKTEIDEVRAGFDNVEMFNVNELQGFGRDQASMFFQEVERVGAQRSFQSRVRNALEQSNATVYTGKMSVTPVDGGYRATYRIGHTEATGFSSAKKARAAARMFRESRVGNDANVQIKYKNDNGRYVNYNPDNHPARGEFLVEVKQSRVYNMDDVGFYDLENDFQGVTGSFAKFLDKDSLFSEFLTTASNVASDNSEFIRKGLTELRLPYERLPQNKRLVAMDLLTRQSDDGMYFSFDEIMEQTGDLDIARAVLSVRRFTMALRQLTNTRMRSALVEEGQRHVTIKLPTEGSGPMLDRNVFGRVVDNPNDINRNKLGRVYDPEAGGYVDFDEAQLEEFYNTGGVMIRARGNGFRVPEGTESATYVMYRRGSRRVAVEDLPEYVVRNRDGYLPRAYKDPYVVYQSVEETIDGVTRMVRRPVVFAATRGDAEDFITMRAREFARENDGEALTGFDFMRTDNVKPDDELAKYLNTDSVDFYEESGQLFLSERNDEAFGTLIDGGFDGKRGLRDIDEALRIAESRVANRHSMQHLLNVMTRRWENTFGSEFGDEAGRMPILGDLPEVQGESLRELRAQAITMRDHIQLLMGVDDSSVKRNWRRAIMKLSDWTSTRSTGQRLARRAGRRIADLRDSTPLDWGRQAAFTQFIVANPIRQVALQAQQASVYLSQNGAMSYFMSGKGWRDQLALTWGLATRNSRDWNRHRRYIAERFGMDQTEYEQMLDAYIESGLSQAVDTHQYAVGMSGIPTSAQDAGYFRNTGGSRFLRPFIQAGNFARRIGFDAGEHWQLQTAWLTERNRWLIENPGADWRTTEALATIGGRARSMSFNMSRAGTLGTQQGVWSAMFQFMTHSIKAMQVLIPQEALGQTIGRFSNKRYTGAQRRALWAQQTLLYGTGWLGYDQLINDAAETTAGLTGEVVEVPEEVQMLIREGLMGTAVNYGAALMDNPELYDEQINAPTRYLEGEGANVVFSDNFAPFSGMHAVLPNRAELDGNPLTKIYEAAFLNGSVNPVEFVFGPGYQTVSTFADRVKQAAFIMGETRLPVVGNENGELDFDDFTAGKLPLVIQEAASYFPLFNNIWKGRLVDRTGRLMTSTGQYGVEATRGEAWAKALLGLETMRERQNRTLTTELQGVMERSIDPTDKDYQQLANAYYDRILRVAIRQHDGEITPQQADEMMEVSSIATYMLFDDEVERALFHDKFREKLFSDIMDNGDVRLIQLLTSGRSNNQIATTPEVITRITNMAPFPGKEAVLRHLRVYSELHHGRPPATSP